MKTRERFEGLRLKIRNEGALIHAYIHIEGARPMPFASLLLFDGLDAGSDEYQAWLAAVQAAFQKFVCVATGRDDITTKRVAPSPRTDT